MTMLVICTLFALVCTSAVVFAGPLPNDQCENAQDIGEFGLIQGDWPESPHEYRFLYDDNDHWVKHISYTTVGATPDVHAYCDNVLIDGPGVWYSYTAKHPGVLTLDTCRHSTFDTGIAVLQGSCSNLHCVANEWRAPEDVGARNPKCANGLGSEVSVLVNGGQTVRILVYAQRGLDSARHFLNPKDGVDGITKRIPLTGNFELTIQYLPFGGGCDKIVNLPSTGKVVGNTCYLSPFNKDYQYEHIEKYLPCYGTYVVDDLFVQDVNYVEHEHEQHEQQQRDLPDAAAAAATTATRMHTTYDEYGPEYGTEFQSPHMWYRYVSTFDTEKFITFDTCNSETNFDVTMEIYKIGNTRADTGVCDYTRPYPHPEVTPWPTPEPTPWPTPKPTPIPTPYPTPVPDPCAAYGGKRCLRNTPEDEFNSAVPLHDVSRAQIERGVPKAVLPQTPNHWFNKEAETCSYLREHPWADKHSPSQSGYCLGCISASVESEVYYNEEYPLYEEEKDWIANGFEYSQIHRPGQPMYRMKNCKAKQDKWEPFPNDEGQDNLVIPKQMGTVGGVLLEPGDEIYILLRGRIYWNTQHVKTEGKGKKRSPVEIDDYEVPLHKADTWETAKEEQDLVQNSGLHSSNNVQYPYWFKEQHDNNFASRVDMNDIKFFDEHLPNGVTYNIKKCGPYAIDINVHDKFWRAEHDGDGWKESVFPGEAPP